MDDTAIHAALRQLEQSRTEKLRELEKVPVWRELQKVERGIKSLRDLLEEDESDEGVAYPTLDDYFEQPASEVPTVRDLPALRGREAIRWLLEERAGEWLTVKHLANEMLTRGWLDSARPNEAVRTSADRLVRDDPQVEKGRGIYRLIPPDDEEDLPDENF